MPMYEYRCCTCGKLIEEFTPKINDEKYIACDAEGCEGLAHRIISKSKVLFMGDGWTTESSYSMNGAIKMNQKLKNKSSRG